MTHYYFGKRKKTKKKKILFLIFLLFLILICGIGLSPIFKIKTIEISGNKDVSAEEIKETLDYKNIFLLPSSKIKKDLLKKFPQILDLEINKNIIKQTLKLIIKEREEIGIICEADPAFAEATAGRCFYIDNEGIIFKKSLLTSGFMILLINDFSERQYDLGDKIFDKNLMELLLKIKDKLANELDIPLAKIDIVSYPIKDIRATTYEGWKIIFSNERNIDEQILELKTALKEKIKNTTGLEYIDLRIENRIYYK